MKIIKPILTCCVIVSALYSDSANNPGITLSTIESYEKFKCMFAVIYHEARGETTKGQALVAKVVLNRKQSKHYPNTVCSVVKQRKQFSDVQSTFKKLEKQGYNALNQASKGVVTKSAYNALYSALELPGAYAKVTHYHASYVTPYWSSSMKKVVVEGNHVFYR